MTRESASRLPLRRVDDPPVVMDLHHVERIAAFNHGLVPLSRMRRPHETDERRMRMPSTHSWHRAVASGQLVLVHPGVARLRGAPQTRELWIAAAALAVPGSIASHRSAAHLWGVDRPGDDPVELTVARDRARRGLDGVVMHRPTDVIDLRPVTRSRIATTNVLRMLCDLGAVDPVGLPAAVEHAIVSGHVRLAAVHALLQRHGRSGRTGIGPLRAVVEAWPLGEKPPDSVLEIRMARLLREYRLPTATFHAIVGGFEVDFLIEGTAIVLECDGWEWHAKRPDRARLDRERDAHLLALGHPTLRFTWGCITDRREETAGRIRAVLEQWSPHVLAGG